APQRLLSAPALAATLGRFLAALHAAPSERMAQFVSPDQVPMAEWRDEAAENYTAVVKEIPATRRGPVEAFLTAAPPKADHRPPPRPGPTTACFPPTTTGKSSMSGPARPLRQPPASPPGATPHSPPPPATSPSSTATSARPR